MLLIIILQGDISIIPNKYHEEALRQKRATGCHHQSVVIQLQLLVGEVLCMDQNE